MKSSKQGQQLSLLIAMLFVFGSVLTAQEPSAQMTVVMAREELASKAKQAIRAQEPKWKLIQYELVGVNFYQTWQTKRQKVEIIIIESISAKEAARNFRSSLISSETIESKLEGLGDEAGYVCSWRSGICGLSVRKGKVVFRVIAPSLELAKRFASHALTVDDEAMKAEN